MKYKRYLRISCFPHVDICRFLIFGIPLECIFILECMLNTSDLIHQVKNLWKRKRVKNIQRSKRGACGIST